MNIKCVCGSGLGSSLLLEMNVKFVLDKLNVNYDSVEHTNISSFNSRGVDLVVIGADVAPSLDFDREKMVILTNILSKEELESKLKIALKLN
ncbi:PTS galactitol transporter subunit IIB [Mesomycoplasma ovipneumoniae]|uniref:PTS galactitol transporter subunit IIB n=1 Tax=Mesomycoplasma ovipneumoniae TaxID=29562 RepID=UPI00083E7324|nr:PTS galactitol transporter subunit IIB [Mesomycoplasma ovipneumoniae]MCP9306300.1 PTS galactitol transporter subunit IIB [Mesomycoplasma ovipneumoniae]MDW2862034.1 PTS galactitol transporter subunit IIB [Mesomycoplasma ovipneumoniae]MDW2923356.1 PTS galactitol transporter subunit IIB [Mesomycoplasma ovipneumoniae]WNM13742.1 PTS galactitol transporter subunit IIB [Mesomycoplasma ovipneumoniae]WNM13952.1 PTS galactitol transporter subunit IIB [Mesomycoplasma ovipneumoniae]